MQSATTGRPSIDTGSPLSRVPPAPTNSSHLTNRPLARDRHDDGWSPCDRLHRTRVKRRSESPPYEATPQRPTFTIDTSITAPGTFELEIGSAHGEGL
jgi:hypothetical protein